MLPLVHLPQVEASSDVLSEENWYYTHIDANIHTFDICDSRNPLNKRRRGGPRKVGIC
jgi:hypothetical protein